jgi:hypothetical protein
MSSVSLGCHSEYGKTPGAIEVERDLRARFGGTSERRSEIAVHLEPGNIP